MALKFIKTLATVAAMTLIVAGCASKPQEAAPAAGTPAPKADPIVLKYNDINSPTSPQGMFGTQFAKLVEQKTEGRVKVDTFFGGALVGYDIEPVRSGIADFNQLVPSNVADLEPVLSLLDAPYLYKNDAHLLKVTDPRSPVVKAINEKLAAKGIRLLTTMPMGMRNITTTKKEIKTADDLKGLKIRVVPSKIYMDTIAAFGAVPTPMAFSEVATGLVTGVIDGQENPYAAIVPNGLHEIQKNMAMTGHLPTNAGIFMNDAKFKKLSAKDQELLLDAAVEARASVVKYMQDKDKEWAQTAVSKGMKVIDEKSGLDLNSFKEKVKPVIEKYKPVWGDIYQMAMDLGK